MARTAMKPRNTSELLAQRERIRLLEIERRDAARAVAVAVRDGIAETVSLDQARGGEFNAPPARRGEREKPVRRMSGLEWLHSKKRITDDQKAAGERYGACYRRAKGDDAIQSILADRIPTGRGTTLARLLEHAEGTAHAQKKLAMYRRQIGNEISLVEACDVICGQEFTPREASKDGTGAARVEALLLVALNLMLKAAGPNILGQDVRQPATY